MSTCGRIEVFESEFKLERNGGIDWGSASKDGLNSNDDSLDIEARVPRGTIGYRSRIRIWGRSKTSVRSFGEDRVAESCADKIGLIDDSGGRIVNKT